jgi:hypothetical protein
MVVDVAKGRVMVKARAEVPDEWVDLPRLALVETVCA